MLDFFGIAFNNILSFLILYNSSYFVKVKLRDCSVQIFTLGEHESWNQYIALFNTDRSSIFDVIDILLKT